MTERYSLILWGLVLALALIALGIGLVSLRFQKRAGHSPARATVIGRPGAILYMTDRDGGLGLTRFVLTRIEHKPGGSMVVTFEDYDTVEGRFRP